jgi:hypothetical protein
MPSNKNKKNKKSNKKNYKNKNEYKLILLDIIDYMHQKYKKDNINYQDFCEYITPDKNLTNMPEYAKIRLYRFLMLFIRMNDYNYYRNRMHQVKNSPYNIIIIFENKSYSNVLYLIDMIYYKKALDFEITVNLFCNYLDLFVDLTLYKGRTYLMRIYEEIIEDCNCNEPDCSFKDNRINEDVLIYFKIMTESLLYNSKDINLDLDIKDDDGYSVLDYIKKVDNKYSTNFYDFIHKVRDNILFYRSVDNNN